MFENKLKMLMFLFGGAVLLTQGARISSATVNQVAAQTQGQRKSVAANLAGIKAEASAEAAHTAETKVMAQSYAEKE